MVRAVMTSTRSAGTRAAPAMSFLVTPDDAPAVAAVDEAAKRAAQAEPVAVADA